MLTKPPRPTPAPTLRASSMIAALLIVLALSWTATAAADSSPALAVSREQPVLLAEDVTPALEYSRQNGGAAVLIMRNGEIIVEDYQNGRKPDEAGYLASGTKSFWGPVVAAMIQDGLVESFDERVAETVEAWRHDPVKSQITIRHLLRLTSGLAPEPTLIGDRTSAIDKYAAALAIGTNASPGTYFRYGPEHYYALGALLKRKLASSNESPLDYLKRRILDPLGADYGQWRQDEQGNPNIPNGASMTPRHWALYGRFLARYGRSDDRQIVREDLIRACFEPSPRNPGAGLTLWLNEPGGYGLLKTQRSPSGTPGGFIYPQGYPGMVAALGAGKNRMYIFPGADLVIVRQAIGRRDDFVDSEFLSLLLNAPDQQREGTARTHGDANSTPDPFAANTAERLFYTLDTNGDGQVTPAEIPKRRKRLRNAFERLDRNGDGGLTADELRILGEKL